MNICYEDFSDMCYNALDLLLMEEDPQRLNNPVTEIAMRKMLYFFEREEEFEMCLVVESLSQKIFGYSIKPIFAHEQESEA